MSASVTIAIRAGATLLSESEASESSLVGPAFAYAADLGAIDGGLDIVCEGQRVSWPDVWDHVDGMLVAWLVALDELSAGAAEATAVFPDTRVECELRRVDDNRVAIEYEDVAATVDRAALQHALRAAAGRLLELTQAYGLKTDSLQALQQRHDLELRA